LRELVESFLDFVEPEARERGVQLEVNLAEEPAEARLDAELFRQAFLNLVRNSFEAMPAGGVLQVRLERAGDEWVLEVADSGRGIPADLLPRVFDPFFTTKKDGTGLGLAHVRRVVEQHGGTIACASQPGQGTRFTVRLPAATPSQDIPMEEVSVLQEGR
jgi:signal transduction histidine kinase